MFAPVAMPREKAEAERAAKMARADRDNVFMLQDGRLFRDGGAMAKGDTNL